jgi:hypothetical protein
MPDAIREDCLQSVELDSRQIRSRVYDYSGYGLSPGLKLHSRFAEVEREPLVSDNLSNEMSEPFCRTRESGSAGKREIVGIARVSRIEFRG